MLLACSANLVQKDIYFHMVQMYVQMYCEHDIRPICAQVSNYANIMFTTKFARGAKMQTAVNAPIWHRIGEFGGKFI